MNKNEIKKALYRQKPIASFMKIKNGCAYYVASIEEDDAIIFKIPVNDMGDAEFTLMMDAKLLIRWLQI